MKFCILWPIMYWVSFKAKKKPLLNLSQVCWDNSFLSIRMDTGNLRFSESPHFGFPPVVVVAVVVEYKLSCPIWGFSAGRVFSPHPIKDWGDGGGDELPPSPHLDKRQNTEKDQKGPTHSFLKTSTPNLRQGEFVFVLVCCGKIWSGLVFLYWNSFRSRATAVRTHFK